MANIYRRGSTYWGRVQVRGRSLRKSLRTTDRREAARRLAHWVATLRATDIEGKPRKTYIEAMERFDQEYVEALRPNTARRYRTSIRALHHAFASCFLDEIGRSTVAPFIQARLHQGVSPATTRHDLAVLGSLCRQAVAWGWIDHNPVRDFDKSSIPQAGKRERFLTQKEVEALKEKALPDLRAMIVFAVETGMRVGEMLALKWADVDGERHEATLWHTKNGTSRLVPLSPQAIEAMGTRMDTGYVFRQASGRPHHPERVSRRFGRTCRRVGLCNATFHDLRHTFASWALQGRFPWQRGAFDIPRLQRWLGHKSIQMTMRYAHLASDDLRALVKR